MRAHSLPQLEAMHLAAAQREERDHAGQSLRFLQMVRIAIGASFDPKAAARANELQESLVRRAQGEKEAPPDLKKNRSRAREMIKRIFGG